MQKGILYVATGARYVEEARSSARSVRACNPGLPICLVTDQSIEPDADFDIVRDVHETPSGTAAGPENYLALDRVAYYRKILPLVGSPFEKTLFLDTDTWVGDSLEDLFTLLDSFVLSSRRLMWFMTTVLRKRKSPFLAFLPHLASLTPVYWRSGAAKRQSHF
jgi:hypothetical protein